MEKLETFIIRFFVLTHMITSFDVAHTKNRNHCYDLSVNSGLCTICEHKATCYNVNSIPNFEEFITTLELNDNKNILGLTGTSFSHTNYKYIQLANNSISDIAIDTFSDLKKLKELDLSNNKISFLNENLFENTIELNALNLQDNPDLNISTHNLPQSLINLNLQNTNSYISLSSHKELKHLRYYKGKLCMDDNCTSYLYIGGALCKHVTDIPQNSEEETEKEVPTNCNDFSSKSSNDNTNYKNIEKILDYHLNILQGLVTSVENTYKQISKIENTIINFNDNLYRINMSLAGLHNEVGDNIHKIHNQFYDITIALKKLH